MPEFEAQIRDLQQKRGKLTSEPNETAAQPKGDSRVGLGQEGFYDTDIYDKNRSRDEYVTSIPATDEQEVF